MRKRLLLGACLAVLALQPAQAWDYSKASLPFLVVESERLDNECARLHDTKTCTKWRDSDNELLKRAHELVNPGERSPFDISPTPGEQAAPELVNDVTPPRPGSREYQAAEREMLIKYAGWLRSSHKQLEYRFDSNCELLKENRELLKRSSCFAGIQLKVEEQSATEEAERLAKEAAEQASSKRGLLQLVKSWVTGDYELKEQCSKQAAEYSDRTAKQYKSDETGGPFKFVSSSYQAHYNSRLDKCFILDDVLTVSNEPGLDHSFSVTEINENKKYGVYWERFHVCWVHSKTTDCWPQTEKQWRELIRPLMKD